MSARAPNAAPAMLPLLWQARPIRFLMLVLVGWVTLRSLIVAAEMRQEAAGATVPPGLTVPGLTVPVLNVPARPWSAAPSRRIAASAGAAAGEAAAARRSGLRAPPLTDFGPALRPPTITSGERADADTGGGWAASNRHFLRLAMLGGLVPTPTMARGGMDRATHFGAPLAPWLTAPPAATPLRMRGADAATPLARWSLAAWIFVRGDGIGGSPASGAPFGGPTIGGATLGGSQAGLRLARTLDPDGRVSAFVRLTVPPRRTGGSDAAAGISWRPLRKLPVSLNIEQRIALGGEARTAPAAYAVGGVGDVALVHGFRLDAYGQAGVVGVRRPDAFVDGAVGVERRFATVGGAPLSAGAVVAAAAQPGASRVDIGPRVSLRFPVGRDAPNSRLSLDWRARVAGDAAPGSGLALTLAGDF
ncbi:MAG: hypothetical protein RLZZ58_148 [Pseudomonadota bacterium]